MGLKKFTRNVRYRGFHFNELQQLALGRETLALLKKDVYRGFHFNEVPQLDPPSPQIPPTASNEGRRFKSKVPLFKGDLGGFFMSLTRQRNVILGAKW